ncbi:LPXTG cell wall anchor domain-containing protein [Jiangella aurantiaca]|uniref:LPXTG cell wall anchor domain-containing protein n=1 Tax=Jiangella aurantiaca TaxID=2530373 RepID=UPI0013A5E1D3|nr:LPXTG cell wall anchor domain-containing protein [Jiangella aurantiaca]
MRKVTIAILAGLALLFGGALPAWAEVQDPATWTETTEETKAPEATDCDDYAQPFEGEGWCDPAHGDYDCDEIPEEYLPVQLVPGSDDPFGLDADGDGFGCDNGSGGGGDAGGGPAEEPPAEEPADEPGPCAHYADSAEWCSDTHGDYNCPDIDDAHKPIELFDAEKDPFHLDRDSDAVGCEIGEDDDDSTDAGADGNADDGAGDDDGGAAGAGVGGDGEELPNTGSGDLGALWLATVAFLAAGALLVYRRTAAQR